MISAALFVLLMTAIIVDNALLWYLVFGASTTLLVSEIIINNTKYPRGGKHEK